MKKTLDTISITNELKGASLHFTRKTAREAADTETVSSTAGISARCTGIRTPVSSRRPIGQRQPFDIFEDQYRNLKQIAEDERSQGLPGGMSRMVREAIDH